MSESDQPRHRRWDLDRYKVGTGADAPDLHFDKKEEDEETQALLSELYDAKRIRARYYDEGTLFWIALRTAMLTVVTLGIYRFWMVTRLRRYFAHAIRIDGDPLEYTGTGLEKFLGFLLALIVLAVYLGLINLGLAFIGLSYLEGNPLGLQLSIIAALPLFFWAAYRARRYFLSRMRWRGIRFGVEPGAWGYAGRSILWTILTIATAGLALPYQHYKQAEYMTDRTWMGDLPFEQHGSWTGLFAIWIWLYLSAAFFALVTWGIVAEGNLDEEWAVTIGTVMIVLWVPLAAFIFFAYQIGSFRYLWDHRTLGDAELSCDLSVVRIFGVYVGGYFLLTIFGGLAAVGIGILVFGAWVLLGGVDLETLPGRLETAGEAERFAIIAEMAPALGLAVLGYLLIFAVIFAFTQSFITQPILRRKVEGMVIDNPKILREAAQREHDDATEAGGFADALGVDVGAGL